MAALTVDSETMAGSRVKVAAARGTVPVGDRPSGGTVRPVLGGANSTNLARFRSLVPTRDLDALDALRDEFSRRREAFDD